MTTLALSIPHFRSPFDFVRQPSGVGQDSHTVEQKALEIQDSYLDSHVIVYRDALVAAQFKILADEWRQSIRFRSSLTEITDNPIYRAITQLGADVVPLLLRELQQRPEPWFAALREITRQDPVPAPQRGDMKAMAQAWLRWGRQRGLIR